MRNYGTPPSRYLRALQATFALIRMVSRSSQKGGLTASADGGAELDDAESFIFGWQVVVPQRNFRLCGKKDPYP
jgi:hypothetical protein